MRKEFEMTEVQFKKIIDASKPVRYIMSQCGNIRSPQENSNDAWKKLGKEMGFKYITVQPNGKGNRFFTAETT